MSRLTIRPTATKPYTETLSKAAMSPVATESDVQAAAVVMDAYNDAMFVAQDGGLFIVPTVDPGVTGALWNDAGTLSISV